MSAGGFPLESAGFADVELFGPVVTCMALVLVSVLAIAAGELVVRVLLAPRHA